MNLLKLSAYQTWILADRPEDCLEENLRHACQDGQFPLMSEEEIAEHVGSVTGLFKLQVYTQKKGTHPGFRTCWNQSHFYAPTTIDVDGLTDIQRYVLEDAFSGSTFCGQVAHLFDHPDPKERLRYANAKRSMHIIGRKFRECGLQGDFIPDF